MTSEKNEFECAGKTTDGEQYDSIASMWKHELGSSAAPSQSSHVEDDKSEGDSSGGQWYSKSETYWSAQKASVEGMLGGLGALHERDISASRRFLNGLELSLGRSRALDVGAGIGRVTKHLLLPEFQTVDMLEQSVPYLNESRTYVDSDRVGRRIACGMQEFRAAGVTARDGVETGCLRGVYDVIWIQWSIGFVVDNDFVSFLKECMQGIADDGLIVVKDNVARSGFLIDKEDSSIMRSNRYLLHLFSRAGLTLIKSARQTDFPKSIYPVRMYALRPSGDSTAQTLPTSSLPSEDVGTDC